MLEDEKVEEVTEETEEEVKTEEKSEKTWDKEKQRADQAEANYRKLRQNYDDIQERFESQSSEISQMREKLESLTKVDVDDIDAEFDPDLVDPKVAKAIKSLHGKYKDAITKLTDTERKIAKYEQAENQKIAMTAHEKKVEEILSLCDEEVGAKYRNAAQKLADELVEKGDEVQPKTEAAAIKLMMKCYKKVKADGDKPQPKKAIPTDTGSKSVRPVVEGKPGSLDDVLSELKGRQGWKMPDL